MLAVLKKLWKDLMCEDDAGTTVCPVRFWGGGFGVPSYLGAAGYMLHQHGTINLVEFATGFAAIVGVIAGGIAVKSKMGADAP